MTFTISAFVTFLTIIDPVGLAPVVVGLTAHLTDAQRNRIVARATFISAGIILFFALVGRFLLDRLGISLYAFNMAGGALLFLVGILRHPGHSICSRLPRLLPAHSSRLGRRCAVVVGSSRALDVPVSWSFRVSLEFSWLLWRFSLCSMASPCLHTQMDLLSSLFVTQSLLRRK